MGIYTAMSLAIGLIAILFFGWIMHNAYMADELEHWVPPILMIGIIIINQIIKLVIYMKIFRIDKKLA